MESNKCILIIDKDLPLGVIANTAAVLTLSLGKAHPELVGENIRNRDSGEHLGITQIPISILAGTNAEIKIIRDKLHPVTTLVDFSSVAKGTKNYKEYASAIAETAAKDIEYLGIAVFGDKKVIAKYTGNMRLMR